MDDMRYNKTKNDWRIEMGYSNSARLGYEFESIIADIFRSYGFTATLTDGKYHDIDVIKGEIKLAVEVKLFRDIKANNNAVLSAAEKVCHSAKESDFIPVIVSGNVVDERIRVRLKEYPTLFIVDIQNLLYLVDNDEVLRSRLLSVLSFSTDDLLPQESTELKKYNLNKLPPQKALHEDLIERIKKWEPSLKENTLYEKLCTDVIKYLFDSDLALWKEQQKSNDDLFRFDLICKIKDGTNKEFWTMAEKHFGTKYIIFEFKNYTEQITQKEIFTTEKYLYLKALRGIAIIISTKGSDKNADKAIRGTLRENGKLIISLTNEDLIEMIERKAIDDNLPAEFLSEKLDNMLVNLEK
ncbi:hypothetical protein [Hydrogenoanaerobacterium sp.]|uniref:hypothetical protein n=1 Tax=Hydrogenoanaerobacterium sp. TaxID=2953763 RepID=UPI00289B5A0A|nr:hypothetical protein [Hydrogenoanaerobacterium sp.]